MDMVKLLCTAWLKVTSRTGIRVIAALYHSGQIRQGVSGPMVQWIAHPKCTARNAEEAIAALTTLPENGTGSQSDAISQKFLLDEAMRVARGASVYAVFITDCCWNRSFSTSRSPAEEVSATFEDAYNRFKGKLNITLVGLGVKDKTGFEDSVDHVIAVSDEELGDVQMVAEKIGSYVASCLRETRRTIQSR